MPAIYNVTIEDTGEDNRFRVTWHDADAEKEDFFHQETEIAPAETEKLWEQPGHQLAVGQKLFRLLDGDSRHFKRALDQARQQGESLQVYLRARGKTADWPFELLADNGTFLLPQRLHLVRHVSDWGRAKKIHPGNHPLKLLFMACSAMDAEIVLDYEQEEEAVFQVTERLPVDMDVEDSGSLTGLRNRLEQEQYDVVHLSGHANIDENGCPYFIMEDDTGHTHQVFPDMLWAGALIENPPRLLFLSGCRTGETPVKPDGKAAVSFSRVLVENYNVPAVLGWGRSVSDDQAIHAEKMLFHELSRGRSILDAVQRARYELQKGFTGSPEPAWPLLRLFSSGMALNPIVKKGQRAQPKPQRMTHVFLENSRVRVLAEGFVGRRRQLQSGLQALTKDFYKVGALLLGAGGLGKSCLAGKICEHFPDHTLIIIHGKLDAVTLKSALTDAFIMSRDKKAQQILAQKTDMTRKLANLCATGFKEKNYLLLLDDFDRNLEGTDKGQPGSLLPEAADLLKVLLHYLPFSGKMTQLIITCRYGFSLTEQGRDLVEERLEKLWLTSFRELEQVKKGRELKNIFNYPDEELAAQVLSAGFGNPLLMEWLDQAMGQNKEAQAEQLKEALAKRQEDFIREYVNPDLLRGCGDELLRFLRCLSVYRRPVPAEGVEMVAEKAGIQGWQELMQKAIAVSLVEVDRARRRYQVTPLLREELSEGFEDISACHEAASAYYEKISEVNDADPLLAEEWVFHLMGCGNREAALERGTRFPTGSRHGPAFRGVRLIPSAGSFSHSVTATHKGL